MSNTNRTRRPKWRRALIALSVTIGVTAALLTASSIANVAISNSEKADITPYGQKIALDAGDINVYRNGGTGPTLVMLSGFGTPAPAVDFAPLIRELDAFDVIVIEGFGYGFSDIDVPNRSIENITSEIHEVLDRLNVATPVVLLGHSVAGSIPTTTRTRIRVKYPQSSGSTP
ncbi:MAG: alpha/beta hydrolase [Salinibacterium sp.]|nr:alpha/beta hydrolase [Salinibacterium sp.]